MQKINYILIVIILNSGCSVVRNRESNNFDKNENVKSEILIENVLRQNLTVSNFYIQKAEIEIVSPKGMDKILGSLKFEKPDKYLISLKSRTGIEAARIFISDDTILINDRINRKLYCGSAISLKRKYGFTQSVLPITLGDYVENKLVKRGEDNCSDGQINIVELLSDFKIKYVIDCRKMKTILATPENGLKEMEIEMQFSNFLKTGDKLSPRKIMINDFRRKAKIEIQIKKIEYPWDGNIEFIPGNKYEILPLL